MATYLDQDGSPLAPDVARARLAAIGTEVHPLEAEATIVATVLAPDERQVRAELDADPPEPGSEDDGMGAWHANARDEAHSVLSGTGLMQFQTPDGAVTVVLGEGDVVVVRGGEHRYRAVTAQRWRIRHSGGPDDDLGAASTGRPGAPWPVLG